MFTNGCKKIGIKYVSGTIITFSMVSQKLLVVINLTTEEDLEEASGRGDRESWFEEGGCSETRQVEGRSARNCRRNGVNPAISAKGKTPDKN